MNERMNVMLSFIHGLLNWGEQVACIKPSEWISFSYSPVVDLYLLTSMTKICLAPSRKPLFLHHLYWDGSFRGTLEGIGLFALCFCRKSKLSFRQPLG